MLLVRHPKNHSARSKFVVIVVILTQLRSWGTAHWSLERVAFKIFIKNVLAPLDFGLTFGYSKAF